MSGELCIDAHKMNSEAVGSLLAQSVAEGTKNTYSRSFTKWALWRKTRGQPLMLDPHDSEAKWEDELCEFYALMGWTMGYAWSTCHGYLYSIRRAHRLQRINLDIRDAAMPLLSLLG